MAVRSGDSAVGGDPINGYKRLLLSGRHCQWWTKLVLQLRKALD